MSGDDLVSLFATTSPGQAQPMTYRQGRVVSWNPITLENQVEVGGTVLANLPVLGVGEATTIQAGSIVGVMIVDKTWAILGRLVIPNTPDAASAVSLLSSQIYTGFIVTGETCTSTTYTDLATVGPAVTVPVGPSGRILVVATAQVQGSTVSAAATGHDGRFNVAFAGANSRTPNEVVDPLVGVTTQNVTVSTGTNSQTNVMAITTQAVFAGLNPGDTVITMKYRNAFGATNSTEFFRRVLTVFKL